MNSKLFSVFECVSAAIFGVDGYKRTFWSAYVFLLVLLGADYGFDVLRSATGASLSLLQIISDTQGYFIALLMLLLIVLGLFLKLLIYWFAWGVKYLGIQRAYGVRVEPVMITTVFKFKICLRMLGLYLLLGLVLYGLVISIVAIDLAIRPPASLFFDMTNVTKLLIILASIPVASLMIYLLLRLNLASAFILREQEKLWPAIKSSFAATKSRVLSLLRLKLVNFVILSVSAIPLGIGLIWSLPYLNVCYGETYKRLIAANASSEEI